MIVRQGIGFLSTTEVCVVTHLSEIKGNKCTLKAE